MSYAERTDLKIGDTLQLSDRGTVVKVPQAEEGVYDWKPASVPKALGDIAWAAKAEKHVYGPHRETFDEYFTPFHEHIGGTGELVAGSQTLNGPETPLHADNWGGAGDDPNVWTYLFCFSKGNWEGGEYAAVDYGVSFDFNDLDLLGIASNIRHGNVPRTGVSYERLMTLIAVRLDDTES